MNGPSFFRAYWLFFLTPVGAYFGWEWDKRTADNLSMFRHKSKLFQGEYEAKMKYLQDMKNRAGNL